MQCAVLSGSWPDPSSRRASHSMFYLNLMQPPSDDLREAEQHREVCASLLGATAHFIQVNCLCLICGARHGIKDWAAD